MAKRHTWSGVNVAMQSALAAEKTLTAITQADPGVVSSTAHDFANGDYIYLEIQGMVELNEKVYRVANVLTDSFQLEDVTGGTGIDTTNYSAFTSGTAKKITFGTSVSTMTDLSASGGEASQIDFTTIHDTDAVNVPGLKSATSYQFTNNWDPTEAGLIAMKQASDLNQQLSFKFTFPNGTIMVFVGYVSYSGTPTGSAQDKVVSPATINMTKSPTYYAS